MDNITLNGIDKAFGGNHVLQDFSALIHAGKMTCIMAPSGKGKTTLLRILMGLDQQDSGIITGLEGLKLSVVFQEDRLCDNLTAAANIRLTCPNKTHCDVEEGLRALGLAGCIHQPTRELSGGMRRRVALLRALMAEYDLLILDEPFKGLDVDTKAIVMEYTRLHIAGKTAILVTHDLEEAQALDAGMMITL